MIKINMNKAREITKARLRIERAPLLAELDIKFQRNIESGSSNADVISEKNRLRDITKCAEDCHTTDELKALCCSKHHK